MTNLDPEVMQAQLDHCVAEVGNVLDKLMKAEQLDMAPLLVTLYVWTKRIESTIKKDAAKRPEFYGCNAEYYLRMIHMIADIYNKPKKIHDSK